MTKNRGQRGKLRGEEEREGYAMQEYLDES